MRLNPSWIDRTVVAALGVMSLGTFAAAGEPWIAPGNTQVRHDVQLLVDSGVIDLPMSAWPIAASDLANALSALSTARAGEGEGEGSAAPSLTLAQQAAISRLRALAREGNAHRRRRSRRGSETHAAAHLCGYAARRGRSQCLCGRLRWRTLRRPPAGDRGSRSGRRPARTSGRFLRRRQVRQLDLHGWDSRNAGGARAGKAA